MKTRSSLKPPDPLVEPLWLLPSGGRRALTLLQRHENQPVVRIHRDHQLINAASVHRGRVRDVSCDELGLAGGDAGNAAVHDAAHILGAVGMMTSPSLPACAAFSVFSSLPSENVSTSLLPMFTTTMLFCGSKATPFG